MRSRRHILQCVLGVLLCVIVYFVFLNDVVQSLMWHLGHGDRLAYDGHSMTLPLMWRQDYRRGDVLELSRAAFFHPFFDGGLSGPESLTLASSFADGPAKLDDAAAARWQSHMVASFKKSGDFAKPENLHSKSITFYCFNRDDGSTHGGCLDCKATGTNWEVVFGVGDGGAGSVQGQLDEARGILKSMQ